MKRGNPFVAALVLVALLTVASCSTAKESSFTIQLEGETGMKVSGAIMVMKKDGNNVSETVTVTLPNTRAVNGTLVSVSMQKQDGGSGTLRVRILKGSTLVGEGSTDSAYGVVAVAGR